MNPKSVSFKPIKNMRAFEGIADKIKQSIFAGILGPGDRLPSEADLAKQFAVGRQTIREAMRILEIKGLIHMRKGGVGGAVVRKGLLDTLGTLFLDEVQLEKVTIDDITLVRVEIETNVLPHAIRNANKSDIKSLQRNIDLARTKLRGGTAATEENIEFHRLLAKASKNHVYYIVVTAIMTVVKDYHSRIPSDLNLSEVALLRHASILEALIEKREEKAIHLLKQHLEEVKNQYKPFGKMLARMAT